MKVLGFDRDRARKNSPGIKWGKTLAGMLIAGILVAACPLADVRAEGEEYYDDTLVMATAQDAQKETDENETSGSSSTSSSGTSTTTGTSSNKSGQWMEDAKGWWYITPEGPYAVGYYTINDVKYYFDSEGYMATGWKKIDKDWYYFKADGTIFSGWYNSGGTWYYMDSKGKMATGITEINGDKYYFDADGCMLTGWNKIEDKWYYLNSDGTVFSGWYNSGGTWYYMDSDGKMSTGWTKVDGYWYYFEEEGNMAKPGWKTIGKYWYYINTDGTMATGVIQVNGTYYDMGTSGGIEDPTLAKAQSYSSNTNYLIMIDRTNYKLYVFTGKKGSWVLDRSYPMSDGASTPNGEFNMGIKVNSFGEDKGYSCWYASQIQGNYLIHSVGYAVGSQKSSDIIDGRMGVTISHGCIRLTLENAKWIYDNVPSGTKIVIYQ